MSDPTLIAIIILGGVFAIMIVTIIKDGSEAAIKMWTVMGALTGVAFGAIISFYFTNEIRRIEVAQLKRQHFFYERQLLANDKKIETNASSDRIKATLVSTAPDNIDIPHRIKHDNSNNRPKTKDCGNGVFFTGSASLLAKIKCDNLESVKDKNDNNGDTGELKHKDGN